jgi:hypothetical protein
MQCEKFERRLQQVLDERGRAEDDAQLRFHAESCPACRGKLAAQQSLWIGLAQQDRPQPGPEFASAVVQVLQRTCSPARPSVPDVRRRAFHFAVGMAAAVLLLTAAILWSLRQGGASSVPTNNFVQSTGAVIEENIPALEPSSEGAPLENVTRTSLPDRPQVAMGAPSLREEQYAELFDKWRLQITETSGRLGLSGPHAPTVQGAAAVSELTDRLRLPLAASIESTLNVLRTALPSGTTEKTQAKPQARMFHLRAGGLA